MIGNGTEYQHALKEDAHPKSNECMYKLSSLWTKERGRYNTIVNHLVCVCVSDMFSRYWFCLFYFLSLQQHRWRCRCTQIKRGQGNVTRSLYSLLLPEKRQTENSSRSEEVRLAEGRRSSIQWEQTRTCWMPTKLPSLRHLEINANLDFVLRGT